MSGLPLLPGYNISSPTERQRPIRQSLGWKKGVPLVAPTPGSLLSAEDSQELARQERRLQFGGRRRPTTPPRFLPEWALLDKKVLRFKGYFRERVEGGGEVYRVRPVVISYYLVDDALSVTEPRTPNSGLDQGRLLSRQRVPCPGGGFWHWTHLNLNMTLSLYGRHFIICDCDPFTKEYLMSEGTELNNPLPIPSDPYTLLRQSRAESPSRASDLRPHSAPPAPPRLKGLVLKFEVMVEDGEGGQPGASPAVLLYRPADLSVELRQPSYFDYTEIKKFSPLILRATKVPRGDTRKASFVDIGEEGEVGDWLTPRHLIPPTTVTIFGRRVMVTGCDNLTQRFLLDNYGIDNIPAMKVIETAKEAEGGSSGKTHSDIVPRPRARPGLLNSQDATVLRFSAKLDSPLETEADRCFILVHHVIDDTLELTELARPGGLGGRVLSRTCVPKPKVRGDEVGAGRYSKPHVYTLDDFYIGATLDIWGRRYTITGADEYVLNYARQHEDKVSPRLLSSLINFFAQDEKAKEKPDKNTN
ncbi:EF-hand domain-containing protein 1 isoform X2 [Procambarus clarkii]|uniref:EF-hand domain-containing protein 1 isoform X2 n=1 Tax=Procambarus clarkii TaxID=6728 RepID=UPI003742A617